MSGLDKNLMHLQEHLDPGESVEEAVLGAYDTKIMGNDSVRNGVFAATNRRLVFYAKKLIGFELESFPYENISSFEMSKGMMGHSIAFYASGNSGHMKWINSGDIQNLVKLVRSRMGKKNTQDEASFPPVQSAAQTVDVDPYEKLRKLAKLRDDGIITPEEFEAKKVSLLGSI